MQGSSLVRGHNAEMIIDLIFNGNCTIDGWKIGMGDIPCEHEKKTVTFYASGKQHCAFLTVYWPGHRLSPSA
jgi:hypothetical protein